MKEKEIKEAINKYFESWEPPRRTVTIRTGIGGYDMIMEATENGAGLTRVYIGKKVLRIIRRIKGKIYKSPRGIYYRLVRK